MVQGTMSNAGKSLIVAGLCRIFAQDGYRVAPFKSQNMALNSYITDEGLEMGRAQVMQAEAAGVEPVAAMNPILLKPTTHVGSQVIVNGEVLGNMSARDYFAYKKQLIPEIKKAFRELEKDNDIIVIEGAGSPAEINLRENDIVNMGLAELLDAPVLLVGDIDRGGVFAQLLGTLMLLEEPEKERVKGLIINKFRGDKTILDPGVVMLEERGHVPVVGVVPYMELSIDDEDSLSSRFDRREEGLIDIVVIRYPRISNFTDLSVLEQIGQVSVRYVDSVRDLHHPDMIVLPGSKNTMADLKWMRENGLEALIKKKAQDTIVFGICGGYQMLGQTISDPYQVENGGSMKGMELLEQLRGAITWNMQIVFYTAYDKYMIYAIRGAAFDYLLKPIDKKELEGIIDRFMKKAEESAAASLVIPPRVYSAGEHTFMISTPINDLRILRSIDIGFFRYNSDRKLWEVVLNNQLPLLLKKNTTADHIKGYDSCFVQIHQSYIININYLMMIKENRCVMFPPFENITELQVSKKFRKELQDRFYLL